jgi:hypothetical protein
MLILLTAIFQPSLLDKRIYGGTGYRATYNTHASAMVRLPCPNPLAVRMLWWLVMTERWARSRVRCGHEWCGLADKSGLHFI